MSKDIARAMTAVDRIRKVMQWQDSVSHVYTIIRKVAKAEAVAVGVEKLEDIADELESLNASSSLRWNADMRAINRWRKEKPRARALLWPDHADLCVWLLNQLEASHAMIETLAYSIINPDALRVKDIEKAEKMIGKKIKKEE